MSKIFSKSPALPNVTNLQVSTTSHHTPPSPIFLVFPSFFIMAISFTMIDIGNVKRLFHGTKSANVFGILSRGFMKPNFQELNKRYPYPKIKKMKIRKEKNISKYLTFLRYGVKRTHATGLLGYGIYFADQFAVSHKYTTESGNSRFILVADVALGDCKMCFTHDTSRVAAPEQYP